MHTLDTNKGADDLSISRQLEGDGGIENPDTGTPNADKVDNPGTHTLNANKDGGVNDLGGEVDNRGIDKQQDKRGTVSDAVYASFFFLP